ncbi:fused MFS/spermidine synthase [bacterium]|nr:fused MFS/spermidine synthase [candidate division CSSED10-310 bacterium]
MLSDGEDRHQSSNGVFTLIAGLFFLSGAAGLMYQVLWNRKLSLILGTTHLAVTTILASFMLGLALGSWLLGRIADRIRRPLVFYGMLETGIGLYGLASPFLFDRLAQLHGHLYQSWQGSPALFAGLRIGLCLLVLLVPTTLMGGTLPVIARYFVTGMRQLVPRLGLLYGLNTVGAFGGTVLAGFILIRTAGVDASIFAAGTANIIIGAAVVILDRRRRIPPIEHAKPPAAEPPLREENPAVANTGLERFAIIAYFTAGFAALACEVGWTRGLTLALGSSVYAFTIMLATMLAGIGIGSWVVSRLPISSQNSLQTFAFVEVLIGLSSFISIILLGYLPVLFLLLYFNLPRSFLMVQIMKFGLAAVIMAVPTLLMGAAFPLIGKVYIQSRQRLGKQIGDLYSVNTLGGILGSALTGFLCIPLLGTRNSLVINGCLFVCIGLIGFLLDRHTAARRKRFTAAVLALLAIVMVTRIPPWNRSLMTSAVYVYAPEMKSGFEADRAFLFFEEGVHSLVAVTEKAGVRSLRINGKTDGSNGEDMVTQTLLAQLPLLLHPHPETALIIGWGTGVSAGAALTHPLRRVDCVEIDESVVRASELFRAENRDARRDPRMNLVMGDARTVLAESGDMYDVIVAEPSNPWISGVSNLFTREHFWLYRNRLAPGGILCQWIHSYYMKLDDLKLLLRTLEDVFPSVSLWAGSQGDYLLIAAEAPPVVRTWEIEQRMTGAVLESLQRIGISRGYEVAVRRLLADEPLRRFTGPGPVNTDDHPVVEFSAPRSIFQGTEAENRRAVTRAVLESSRP